MQILIKHPIDVLNTQVTENCILIEVEDTCNEERVGIVLTRDEFRIYLQDCLAAMQWTERR